MSLWAASCVLGAAGALLAAPLVSLGAESLLPRMASMPPQDRARWLLGLLALPWMLGGALVAATLGHCAVPMMLGRADDCVPGVGLCLRDGAPFGPVILLLTVLALARPAGALWHAARGARASRRAAQRLRSLGAPATAHHGWRVPGTVVAMVGFPREELFVGASVSDSLDAQSLDALVAHEDAHLSHHDVWRRMVARVLASAHPTPIASRLLWALDLALEQRCDQRASAQVRDPLVVARTLLTVASLDGPAATETPASLTARVHALCQPHWVSRPRWNALALAALTGLGLAFAALAHQVHCVAEAALAYLA
ncbi:MAG: hypothetical protein Q8Q09_21530 [Deltaproteobacteria bacterium]|nr:hypothetical protein [Deltaproteobacteria bacterium]